MALQFQAYDTRGRKRKFKVGRNKFVLLPQRGVRVCPPHTIFDLAKKERKMKIQEIRNTRPRVLARARRINPFYLGNSVEKYTATT